MKHMRMLLVLFCLAAVVGCGGNPSEGKDRAGGPGSGRAGGGRSPGFGAGMGGRPGGAAAAAVPVEVAQVVRRDIASYIETNGTLEAENEVDIVARTSGPVVELLAEEGDEVAQGALLARLDDTDYRAQAEIARVTLNETRLAFDRAKRLNEEQLISPEAYDQAMAAFESASAEWDGASTR